MKGISVVLGTGLLLLAVGDKETMEMLSRKPMQVLEIALSM